MTLKSGLFYGAGTLALVAAAIHIFDDGLGGDDYFRVGFLVLMAVLMFWLGSRDGPKQID
jgi:hypothetical protein